MLYVDVVAVKMHCSELSFSICHHEGQLSIVYSQSMTEYNSATKVDILQQGTPLIENSGSRILHCPDGCFLQLDWNLKLFQPNASFFPLSLNRLWTVLWSQGGSPYLNRSFLK